MKPIKTVGILIINDDKVLLVRHGEAAGHITGAYGIPAGRIEDGETKKQTAVRELREETGLIASENGLEELLLDIAPADIARKDGTILRFSITVFICRNYSGELAASDETIPEWVEISKIDNYPLTGYTKRMVEEGAKYL